MSYKAHHPIKGCLVIYIYIYICIYINTYIYTLFGRLFGSLSGWLSCRLDTICLAFLIDDLSNSNISGVSKDSDANVSYQPKTENDVDPK